MVKKMGHAYKVTRCGFHADDDLNCDHHDAAKGARAGSSSTYNYTIQKADPNRWFSNIQSVLKEINLTPLVKKCIHNYNAVRPSSLARIVSSPPLLTPSLLPPSGLPPQCVKKYTEDVADMCYYPMMRKPPEIADAESGLRDGWVSLTALEYALISAVQDDVRALMLRSAEGDDDEYAQ